MSPEPTCDFAQPGRTIRQRSEENEEKNKWRWRPRGRGGHDPETVEDPVS